MPHLELQLAEATTVFCSYQVQLYANISKSSNTVFQPTNSFIAQDSMVMAARLETGGAAFRQSSSQALAPAALGSAVHTLQGLFVSSFPRGTSVISVEWRTVVSGQGQWGTVASNGISLTRQLICKAKDDTQHHFTLRTEILRSSLHWKLIPGLQRVLVPSNSLSRLKFGVLVRPLPAQAADLSKSAISMRVSVGGVPISSSAAYYRSVTRSVTTGFLRGEALLSATNSSRIVELQFRTKGGNAWLMDSSMFGGYGGASGFIIEPSLSGQSSSIQPALQPLPASNAWQQVHGGIRTFTTKSEAFVDVSYSLNLLKYGNPSQGVWQWTSWGSIQIAIEVDGELQAGSLMTVGSRVKSALSVTGQTAVRLAAGSHTATVKWRPTENATEYWAAIRLAMSKYAGASVTSAIVDVENAAPVVRFAHDSIIRVFEDQRILPGLGVRVSDKSSLWAPLMHIRVTLVSQNCSLATNSKSVQHRVSSNMAEYRGTLSEVNEFLETLRCHPAQHFHGNATVNITAHDLGNIGSGGEMQHSALLSFWFLPVNDPVQLSVPRTLTANENGTVRIRGIELNDADVEPTAQFKAMLTLHPTNGVIVSSTEALLQAAQMGVTVLRSDSSISLEGPLGLLAEVSNNLLFQPCELCNNWNSEFSLEVVASDLGNFGRAPTSAFFDPGTNNPSVQRLAATQAIERISISIIPVNNAPQVDEFSSFEASTDGLLVMLNLDATSNQALTLEASSIRVELNRSTTHTIYSRRFSGASRTNGTASASTNSKLCLLARLSCAV